MAQEIMIVNSAISNLIREGKTAQMYSMIQTGSQLGMQTLESALKELFMQKKISLDDALLKSQRHEEFKRLSGLLR